MDVWLANLCDGSIIAAEDELAVEPTRAELFWDDHKNLENARHYADLTNLSVLKPPWQDHEITKYDRE